MVLVFEIGACGDGADRATPNQKSSLGGDMFCERATREELSPRLRPDNSTAEYESQLGTISITFNQINCSKSITARS